MMAERHCTSASRTPPLPPDRETNPVRNLEPGLFAGLLDRSNQLAGEAFAAQIRRQGRIEGNQIAAVLGTFEAARRLGFDEYIFTAEIQILSVDVQRKPVSGLHRSGNRGTVRCRERPHESPATALP